MKLDFEEWFKKYKEKWKTIMDVNIYRGVEKDRLRCYYENDRDPGHVLNERIQSMATDAEIR